MGGGPRRRPPQFSGEKGGAGKQGPGGEQWLALPTPHPVALDTPWHSSWVHVRGCAECSLKDWL